MVPAELSGHAVPIEPRRREYPLPDPLPPGVRVLTVERRWKLNPTAPRLKITPVLLANPVEVPDQIRLDRCGQHGDPVLVALGASPEELIGAGADVLDAPAAAFARAQPRTVRQRRPRAGDA